jgi:hypothetical protein
MCTVLLPQGVNTTAVNKYINTSEVTAVYLRTLPSVRRRESSPKEATFGDPVPRGLRGPYVNHWFAYYELNSSTTVLRCCKERLQWILHRCYWRGICLRNIGLNTKDMYFFSFLSFSSTFSSSYYYSSSSSSSFSSYVSTVRLLTMHSRCFLLQSPQCFAAVR